MPELAGAGFGSGGFESEFNIFSGISVRFLNK